jgi:hypothetical protein
MLFGWAMGEWRVSVRMRMRRMLDLLSDERRAEGRVSVECEELDFASHRGAILLPIAIET